MANGLRVIMAGRAADSPRAVRSLLANEGCEVEHAQDLSRAIADLEDTAESVLVVFFDENAAIRDGLADQIRAGTSAFPSEALRRVVIVAGAADQLVSELSSRGMRVVDPAVGAAELCSTIVDLLYARRRAAPRYRIKRDAILESRTFSARGTIRDLSTSGAGFFSDLGRFTGQPKSGDVVWVTVFLDQAPGLKPEESISIWRNLDGGESLADAPSAELVCFVPDDGPLDLNTLRIRTVVRRVATRRRFFRSTIVVGLEFLQLSDRQKTQLDQLIASALDPSRGG